MTDHYDEEAQVEQLRQWLRDNWFPLASGLALGLAAIFGWQGWGQHQDGRASDASHVFGDLGKAAGQNKYDDAKAMADRLVKDFSDTPYAAAGALKLAELGVLDGKLDEAAARLQWVIQFEQNPGFMARVGALLHLRNKAYDAGLLPLARLRLAQVLWQQNKADEALQQLAGDAGTYAPLYAELRGDIKLSQGDRAAARGAYEQALQASAADAVSRDGLQRKLDDLGDAAAVKS
ncbi:YfgM family protein [Nevskia soli]|uniref:YfgM family protein n=1 Tax=Nevskia soli TaxID=418856 RepID=UPI0004A6D36A|nr:tetratricopeptide repeat protein [Nevskia soli]